MENLKERLQFLKDNLTGDFFADMEAHDEIMDIEIKLGIRKPNANGSYFECEGCGA